MEPNRTVKSSKRSVNEIQSDEEYEVTLSSTPAVSSKKVRRMSNPTSAKSPMSDKSLSAAIVSELKDHFDKKTDETQRSFKKYVGDVEKKVDQNTQNIHEMKQAIGRLERLSTGSLSEETTSASGSLVRVQTERYCPKEIKRHKYELARRTLRLWPVNGENDLQLMEGSLKFIYETLLVEEKELGSDRVERARRVRSARARGGPVRDEVAVTFVDASTRDFVISHAKNLSGDSGGSVGIRLEHPDFLGEDFRVLAKFGARMRQRNGEGFKRNIKFNDDEMTLYMDIRLPGQTDWMSVSADIAREACREEEEKKAESVKRLLRANGAVALDSLFKSVRNAGSQQTNQEKHKEKRTYLNPEQERQYNAQGNMIHNPDTFTLR